MPYINPEEREQFDDAILDLAELCESPGQLNYIISKIVLAVAYNSPADYESFNAIDGVLGLAQHEFRRRVIAPYEDAKIRQYGDLFDDPPEQADPDDGNGEDPYDPR